MTGARLLHNGTETSIAAAERAAMHSATGRARVLGFVAGRGEVGATREEISAALNMPLNTVNPRCRELLKHAVVYEAGVRQVASGSWAKVLRLVMDFGQAAGSEKQGSR